MIFCFALPLIIITVRGPLLDTPPILSVILIFTGFAITLYGLCKWQMYREQGCIAKDERVRKIWDKSRSYTLCVTLPFVILIIGLDRAINLELKYGVVWLIIIQVAFTQIIFRWYLNKKKDL